MGAFFSKNQLWFFGATMRLWPSGSLAHLHVFYEFFVGDGFGSWVEMLLCKIDHPPPPSRLRNDKARGPSADGASDGVGVEMYSRKKLIIISQETVFCETILRRVPVSIESVRFDPCHHIGVCFELCTLRHLGPHILYHSVGLEARTSAVYEKR